MTILKTIATLCEHQSETYKKSLVCEILSELKHREQAIGIYNSIIGADFMNRLVTLSRESSFNEATINYIVKIDKITDLDRKEYSKLINSIGNFRVATDPLNKNLMIGHQKFMDYKKGESDASVVTRLYNHMLSDEDLQELFDFVFKS